ncbi:MAG: response regulator, partial [Microcystis aeruginosa]
MSAGEDVPHKIILLVEDSKADIRLIQEALKTSTVPHELVIVRDGVNA